VKQVWDEWWGKESMFRLTGCLDGGESRDHYMVTVVELPEQQNGFWECAEAMTLAALREFAGQATAGDSFRRRMFVEDAEQGFAFIDLSRQRYDVVLMNPPFGSFSCGCLDFARNQYAAEQHDIFSAFVSRALVLSNQGLVGAITARTGF